jgi:hypothetical protein
MDSQPTCHEDRERRIREMAHRIWEDEGRPQGQDKRHWDMAETLIGAGQHDRMKSEASPDPAALPDLAAGVKDKLGAGPGQSAAAPNPRARSRTAAKRRKSSQTSHRE